MKSAINHHFQYAGKEIDWLPMDTQQRYEENLKNNRALLEQYGWIDAKFTYRFNSHGFRCEAFSHDPSVVFLGCSLTLGLGLPVNDTWASLVAKKLNLANFNLALGGAANDTSFRLAYHWLPVIKPQIVIYCSTFAHRLEMITHDNWMDVAMPNFVSPIWGDTFYQSWTDNEANEFYNSEKNCLAVQKLCHDQGIKFVSVSATDLGRVDLARDLAHPGVQANRDFADAVLKKI
jgi:hypothetical protein